MCANLKRQHRESAESASRLGSINGTAVSVSEQYGYSLGGTTLTTILAISAERSFVFLLTRHPLQPPESVAFGSNV
jgi:hypothetical protein